MYTQENLKIINSIKNNQEVDIVKGSERLIEVPYFLSKLSNEKNILDIGTTFASLDYLWVLNNIKAKYHLNISGIDIIQPVNVKSRYPLDLFQFISNIKIYNSSFLNHKITEKFDLISCISTLEHIGFDKKNEADNIPGSFDRKLDINDLRGTRDINTDIDFMNKASATLNKKGRLIITLPYGIGGPVAIKDSLGLYCNQFEYNSQYLQNIIGHKNFKLLDLKKYVFIDECWIISKDENDFINTTSHLKDHAHGVACMLLEKI